MMTRIPAGKPLVSADCRIVTKIGPTDRAAAAPRMSAGQTIWLSTAALYPPAAPG